MSRFRRNRSAALAAPIACLLVALITTVVVAQPPHALDPLPNPLFSIDPLSPTANATPSLTASDVLDKPGPSPVIPRTGLGLNSPLDNLDGLSSDRSDLSASGSSVTFAILFSVDRASVGAAPPDPGLVALNRPFNMQQQAANFQAPADLFMSTLLFNSSGPIIPPFRGPGGGNNTEVINQGDTGGVDYDLKPPKAPIEETNPAEAKDDVDAIADTESTSAGDMRGIEGNSPIFFSVSRNSPSLQTLPGTPSGANVYADLEPTVGGSENLWVSAQQLGLVPGINGDDIDGLIVIDNGNLVFNPGADRIYFTLSRNSPSLGAALSPADIFVSTGTAGFQLFATAADLGLAHTDHIDALEALVTDDIEASIISHALLLVIPGDYDQDGDLDQFDCDKFHDCFSGDDMPLDTDGAGHHTVGVGPGSQFNPPLITVETGDRVTWVWTGVFANVVSGTGSVYDGAFHSGTPTSINGTTFAVDFNAAFVDLFPRPGGAYHYFSQTVPPPGMTGIVNVVPDPCATYDLDFDGDVDCADWRNFKKVYYLFNDTICLPLTIPEFVAVLIGQPILPWHVCLADMNEDGGANGNDIKSYVDAYLAAP